MKIVSSQPVVAIGEAILPLATVHVEDHPRHKGWWKFNGALVSSRSGGDQWFGTRVQPISLCTANWGWLNLHCNSLGLSSDQQIGRRKWGESIQSNVYVFLTADGTIRWQLSIALAPLLRSLEFAQIHCMFLLHFAPYFSIPSHLLLHPPSTCATAGKAGRRSASLETIAVSVQDP